MIRSHVPQTITRELAGDEVQPLAGDTVAYRRNENSFPVLRPTQTLPSLG
jgi:hypothetical protein